jgi:hypothetical protein
VVIGVVAAAWASVIAGVLVEANAIEGAPAEASVNCKVGMSFYN